MLESEREALKLHRLNWRAENKAQPAPYEKEVLEIMSRRGDLEDIRKRLGLSKKKMAELLFVDPSAWTRWTKGVSKVPASVYRSLDWYLQLFEKDPLLQEKLQVDKLEQELSEQRSQFQNEMDELKTKLHSENWREERARLMSQLESSEKLSFAWKALLIATFLLALL